MKKLGIIGCGNMGGAILKSLLNKGVFAAESVIASAKSEEKRNKIAEEYSVEVTDDNVKIAENVEILILAVKPQVMSQVLEEIKNSVRTDQIILTVAAGKNIAFYEEILGSDKKIVRTMPTTSALVDESCSVVVPNANVTDEETDMVVRLYENFGKVEIIPENLMNAFTAVSSSPAAVFMMIEALADGAVACGLPRDKALRMVAQTVYGSAKLALETGKHPGELKDMVCSPAGTTIELVNTLEDASFRAGLMDAFRAASDKSASM